MYKIENMLPKNVWGKFDRVFFYLEKAFTVGKNLFLLKQIIQRTLNLQYIYFDTIILILIIGVIFQLCEKVSTSGFEQRTFSEDDNAMLPDLY